jgi:periplasmic divalent cation tolerance protein
MKYSLVLTTAPRGVSAKKISKSILQKRLAACVNIIPAQQSFYWWKGKIESSKEVLLMAKTKKPLVRELMKFVKKIHSYQVPEIISISMESGFNPYLQWLDQETKK